MKQVLTFIVVLCWMPILPALGQTPNGQMVVTVNNFLDTWVVKQNIDAASSSFDEESIRAQIRTSARSPAALDININQWTKLALRMWLIEDHGVVNKLGHGDPNDPKTRQNLPIDGSILKFTRLDQALEKPIGDGQLYTLTSANPEGFPWVKVKEGDFWITTLKFKHTPYDRVIIGWSASNKKIVAFTWLVH